MGAIADREKEMQLKGPRHPDASSSLAIMKAHDHQLSGRVGTIEQPKAQVVVYGEDSDEEKNAPKIAGSLEVDELLNKEGKVPTPVDFIKLVQSDPDFASRFCYCYRNEDYYDFRIVAFEVIDHEKNPKQTGSGIDKQVSTRENSEYMTVSANGIVHFVGGDTTFLTIPEWEREMRLYRKIIEKPFFQKYKKWKTFSAWKTRMRQAMILNRSDFLNRELFLLDKELANPLIKIRGTSQKIPTMNMIKMNSDTPRTLEIFQDEQLGQRENLEGSIQRIEGEIKDILMKSCRDSMETF